MIEPRTFPIPVGVQTTEQPGSNDVFGKQSTASSSSQTFIAGVALIKGNTAFMPPHIEYRLTLALNVNYVDVGRAARAVRRAVARAPTASTMRSASRKPSSTIISATSPTASISTPSGSASSRSSFDFRGFLFHDQQLGVRLFGNRDNNRFQYNLAAIWRLEKDTNSRPQRHHSRRPRDDWIVHANLFRQDFPFVGLTSQASLTYNINRERGEIEVDDNGFPVRPALIGNLRARNYDVVYLGYNADGRIGRVNLTASAYAAARLGPEQRLHRPRTRAIQSFFVAAEPSYRLRLDPLPRRRPVRERRRRSVSTISSAASTRSSRTRSSPAPTPATGSARPSPSPAAAAPSRSTAATASSTRCARRRSRASPTSPIPARCCSASAPISTSPRSLRLSANVNHLWFHQTEMLRGAAHRRARSAATSAGTSRAAAIWRPQATQNLVFRLSGAVLQPGTGFRDLFANERPRPALLFRPVQRDRDLLR